MLRRSAVALAAVTLMAVSLFASPGASFAAPVSAGRALPVGTHTLSRAVVAASTDDFFQAAALQDSDLPTGLHQAEQSNLSQDDVAALGGSNLAQMLSDAGFIAAYDQAFRADNAVGVLLGAPAGAGDVVSIFSSPDGAESWRTLQAQNAAAVAQQIAQAAGTSITVTGSTALDLPATGDSSSAMELTASGSLGGQSVDVVVDAAFVRRGVVQYTVVVAGLSSQQSALSSMVQALDGRVAAALPLLP